MYLLLTLFLAFVFAEICGYFIHILLHSNKVEFLSRSHMLHHLKDYGPKSGLRRPGEYLNSSRDRTALFGIGLEWIMPIGIISIALWVVFIALQIPYFYSIAFTAAAMLWGYFLFGYIHASLHLQDFWMEKNRFLGAWYKQIRKLHDIHHLNISNSGQMLVNYGICFFFMDRIFGSLSPNHEKFNEPGYQEALKRYSYIFK